jgi:hypothetical protein
MRDEMGVSCPLGTTQCGHCRAKVYVPVEKRRKAEAEPGAMRATKSKAAPSRPSSTYGDQLDDEPAPVDGHDVSDREFPETLAVSGEGVHRRAFVTSSQSRGSRTGAFAHASRLMTMR